MPAVAPKVEEVLGPVLDALAHERLPKDCPGVARFDATVDNPTSLFWEHDIGVLGLSTVALGLHNRSISDRWAWLGVAEIMLDSYPNSPLTSTFASHAVVLPDGTLAKNTSGGWNNTAGCRADGRASASCEVVWAEDAVLGSAVLSMMALGCGRDSGGIGRDAAAKTATVLAGATSRLQLSSGVFTHAANANANDGGGGSSSSSSSSSSSVQQSCCAPASANGALLLAHVAALVAINASFPAHPALGPLRVTLRAAAAAVAAEQREADGMWPTLLSTTTTAAMQKQAAGTTTTDVTGSAFIVAALAAGVASGWFDAQEQEQYQEQARKGFAALAAAVDAEGSFGGVLPPDSGFLLLGDLKASPAEYVARPVGRGGADTAIGALLLAAAAVAQLG